MALDVERCIGCHACSVACKVEHNVPLGRFRTKIRNWDEGTWLGGAAPTSITVPKFKHWFLPRLRTQCEDAPRLNSCLHSAIARGNAAIIPGTARFYGIHTGPAIT